MSSDSNPGLLIMRPGVHPRQVVGKKIPPPPEFSDRREDGLRIERNVAVSLRDGVRILIDIYTPELASQPLPILLGWSPYGKHNVSDRLPWPAADVASGGALCAGGGMGLGATLTALGSATGALLFTSAGVETRSARSPRCADAPPVGMRPSRIGRGCEASSGV